ncbi:LytR/AlgR family response regulator transcription factor [Labilibacter marinus]|uniref:LytR/AlgR family response regulator transcription factor n=1 Tax=Labilibacter marinus TaxID=1477105 RepID=UPI000836DD1C|nr:LytTR family DNA-binding domain-containing protein [Labilibacter marinus]
MNCIIIEDQPPAQRILKKYIDDFGVLELKATFSNALDAMEYLKKESVDLIFLDIHLPKISGIDFLKIMPQKPFVILTTAFPDYAIKSYEFSVIDYLLKPFSFQRFIMAINKIKPHINKTTSSENSSHKEEDRDLYIKSGHDFIKVNSKDIICIKSDADYTEIHTYEKVHLSSEALKHWEEKLSDQSFVRIHKSYIINTSKIDKISGNMVFLSSKYEIPIGRSYKDAFINKYVH